MRVAPLFLSLPLLAASSLLSTACIKQTLIDGQIEGTREASGAFDTIGDYELARSAAQAGLVQFEGLHKLSPKNEDALYLLVKGWGGYAFGFAEDDYEVAVDANDEDASDYHKKRARMAYDRAVYYGLELLSHRDAGFVAAKKTDASMKQWLRVHFDDAEKDAPNLFWTGYAWMARTNLVKADDPAMVGELYVGVAMVERAYALAPSLEHYSPMIALAAYHARPFGEAQDSKALFDQVLEKTQHKNLMVQLNYAIRYACAQGDRALYEKMLNEVLAAQDPDPEQRLTNAIAKRRAKRALTKQHMMDCSMDVSGPPSK